MYALLLSMKLNKIWGYCLIIFLLLTGIYFYMNSYVLKNHLNHRNFNIEPKTNLAKNVKVTFNKTEKLSQNIITDKLPIKRPKITRLMNGVVIPVVYRMDPVAFEEYKKYLSKTEEPLPLQNKVIIILTNHRSGSSFFGELFNQHPDVFYSFEPLIGTSRGLTCEHEEAQIEIIKKMSQCIIPDWLKTYSEIGISRREIWKTRNLYICAMKNFCFFHFTKELCEPKHCPKSKKILRRSSSDCSRDCGKININLVENECRKKSMVVLKLIRFCGLNSLKFLDDLGLDFKIIHLVRDPRGIAYSRHLLKKGQDLRHSLNFTCTKQAKNAKIGLFDPPKWLQGRYKFVRYEDVALYPFEVTKDVYDFVGLNTTSEIYNWIQLNTAKKQPDTNDSLSSDLFSDDKLIRNRLLLKLYRQQKNPWSQFELS